MPSYRLGGQTGRCDRCPRRLDFCLCGAQSDSVPEQALLRALDEPNRLILSQEVEHEYREVIFRPKFDHYVSAERRQHILDIVVFAAERVEPTEAVRECRDPTTTSIWRWPRSEEQT